MIPEHAALVFLSLSTSGLAAFMRALPWPKSWLAVKPLACPVCMSGWSGFAVLGAAYYEQLISCSFVVLGLVWLLCVAVSATIFKTLYPPDIELPLP